MSRGGFKITRSDYYDKDTSDRVNWLDDFANKLARKDQPETPKSAVEIARNRGQQSIMDQISSIMGNKGKAHNSVESIVQEMQERTGLKEYLRRQSDAQSSNTKTASNEPFQNFTQDIRENIINFIKNKIATHRGLIPLPAIQEEVLATFKRDGVQPQDVNTSEVANFINQMIIEERKQNPTFDANDINIGRGVGVKDLNDDDSANSDFFKGLLPISQK